MDDKFAVHVLEYKLHSGLVRKAPRASMPIKSPCILLMLIFRHAGSSKKTGNSKMPA